MGVNSPSCCLIVSLSLPRESLQWEIADEWFSCLWIWMFTTMSPVCSLGSSCKTISNLSNVENLQCASPLQKGPVHFSEVSPFVRFFKNIKTQLQMEAIFLEKIHTMCSRVFHLGVLWCQLAQLPPILLLLKESNDS